MLDFRFMGIKTSWALLGAVCVFSACRFGTSIDKASDETVSQDTLAYEYTDYTVYSQHVITTTETTDTTYFTASYPVFADSTVNRFVSAALLGNDTATVEHEASTSRISEDQLFYLKSRGLDNEQCISMIVNGFCKEVFKELPLEFSVEAVKLLEMKLENSIG